MLSLWIHRKYDEQSAEVRSGYLPVDKHTNSAAWLADSAAAVLELGVVDDVGHE